MPTCDNPRHTGLIVGHERGRLDRAAHQRIAPDDLWIPSGASPEFIAALREGYLKGVTGETLAEEDLGHD